MADQHVLHLMCSSSNARGDEQVRLKTISCFMALKQLKWCQVVERAVRSPLVVQAGDQTPCSVETSEVLSTVRRCSFDLPSCPTGPVPMRCGDDQATRTAQQHDRQESSDRRRSAAWRSGDRLGSFEPLLAYFSDRGRLIQADRGRRFSVIVDDHGCAQAM